VLLSVCPMTIPYRLKLMFNEQSFTAYCVPVFATYSMQIITNW